MDPVRRLNLVIPLLAALAAVVGSVLHERPWLAVALALAGGTVVEGVRVRRQERRLRTVTEQVATFPSDDRELTPLQIDGGEEWQRLAAALNAVAAVLRDRFDELRSERQRVERVLDGLPIAVLLFTQRGLLYANPAAQELFQVARAVDWTPLRVLGSDALADAVAEAHTGDGAVELEVPLDGRVLRARAAEVAPDEVALVVTDVTDARRLEAMRRDFVANASHELKTPVTGIQALADSLAMAMDRDPDRARSMVGRVQHEATRLARMVRDLLDLTRLEEATAQPARQRVDLGEVVRGQVARLGRLAEEREVAVDCQVEGAAPVVGIPEDLKMIVANLLANAIQYNRSGGTVTVTAGREGDVVRLVVADTGIGIPEADRDRIFERFYRVDKARSRALGGTGLGLSLVRNAAERHGGRVTVDSVLGVGSTFTVELPVEGAAG